LIREHDLKLIFHFPSAKNFHSIFADANMQSVCCPSNTDEITSLHPCNKVHLYLYYVLFLEHLYYVLPLRNSAAGLVRCTTTTLHNDCTCWERDPLNSVFVTAVGSHSICTVRWHPTEQLSPNNLPPSYIFWPNNEAC
jgi:hypothetical protein